VPSADVREVAVPHEGRDVGELVAGLDAVVVEEAQLDLRGDL
jgi:hypothetical protein